MSENFGQFVISVSKPQTLSRGSFVITEWEKETATGPLSSRRNEFRANELGAGVPVPVDRRTIYKVSDTRQTPNLAARAFQQHDDSCLQVDITITLLA